MKEAEMNRYNVDGEELYNFNVDLSFPRRNDGTEGHQKAIDFIEKKLEDIDVDYQEEEFFWKDLRKRRKLTRSLPMLILSLRLFIGAIMIFIHDPDIVYGFWWYVWFLEPAWVMIISATLLLVLFIIIYSDCVKPTAMELHRINNKYLKRRERKKFKEKFNQGTNIVVRMGIDGTTDEAKAKNIPIIIIIAHYDSISVKFRPAVQNMLYARIGTVPISSLLCFILLPVTMKIGAGNWLLIIGTILLIISSGFSVFALIMGFFNKLTNQSPGAFDNASGCSTLYGLIKALKLNQGEGELKADIRLIFADCEEEGLMGTIEYLHTHEKELMNLDNKSRVKMVALDGTGGKPTLGLFSSYGMPRVVRCGRVLKKEFKKLAKEQFGIDLKSLWSPYASSDHAVFGEYGFKAIQLFSMGMVSNTKYDTIENVNTETLALTTKVIVEFVLSNTNAKDKQF
ncbi:MAG: M28 family peptidase [Candidatus Lokiarchaeota archaeon]|nr:M28 family peptidase [Candidatus Lokiarchaeota archaeon]